jgi:hypothetical protein
MLTEGLGLLALNHAAWHANSNLSDLVHRSGRRPQRCNTTNTTLR